MVDIAELCNYDFEKPFLSLLLSLLSLLSADVGVQDVDGEWQGQSLFSSSVRYCTYIFTWLKNLVNVSWLTEVKFDSCHKALHCWPTCQKNQTRKAQKRSKHGRYHEQNLNFLGWCCSAAQEHTCVQRKRDSKQIQQLLWNSVSAVLTGNY